jgi:phosphatidylglycerophosphatase C
MDEKSKPVVAAFDFDGTLTYRDSFVLFLIDNFGLFGVCWRIVPVLPTLVLYLFGKASRQEAKECLISRFFSGVPIEKVLEMGERFARGTLTGQFRPEALGRLQWHQRSGHRCIIVSASLDVWLEPWARANGLEGVISSRLEVDKEGKVTGRLEGTNCRRAEKVRRLQEVLGSLDEYVIYAYGDSKGDKELLEAADYPFYRAFPAEESRSG